MSDDEQQVADAKKVADEKERAITVLQDELSVMSERLVELVGDEPTPLVDLLYDISRLRSKDRQLSGPSSKAHLRLTPELIKRVAALVLQGCSKLGAANSCGIPKGTHNSYLGLAGHAVKEMDANPDSEVPLTPKVQMTGEPPASS